MMKLTEEQERWLEALESGEYKQGKGVLHNITDGTFCCLGVACHVLLGDTDRVVENKRIYEGEYKEREIECSSWGERTSILPQKVAQMLNMRTCVGHVKGHDGTETLWKMNDLRGMTFKEIAAFIRANTEKVFRQ